MSSYSVKMMTRVSFQVAGFEDRLPRAGRSGHILSRIQSISLSVRASGSARFASATSVMSSRSFCSRAKRSRSRASDMGPAVAAH